MSKFSLDAEYTRLTTHIDYLDDKIFKFLSLYSQIAIAIIGGSFFLSANENVDPTWAIKANGLMLMVSAGSVLFIAHHLKAWRRYRKELTDRFPKSGEPSRFWYFSETVQCLFIVGVCAAFWLFNPLNAKASDQLGTAVIISAIAVVSFCIFLQFRLRSFKPSLVFLLVGLLLALPNQNEINDWIGILKDKVRHGDVELKYKDVAVSIKTSVGPGRISASDLTIDRILVFNPPVNKTVQPPKNLIKNGSFNVPLVDPASGWGEGLYTSQIRNNIPNSKIVWINFLNADIDAQVVATEVGNALKIINRTGSIPDHVGLMEQVINIEQGIYEFSFFVRGEGVEKNSMQITTTPDWTIFDPKDKNIRHGIELGEEGSFEWKKISEKIKIQESGPITLSVISKGKGELYITGIALHRVSE